MARDSDDETVDVLRRELLATVTAAAGIGTAGCTVTINGEEYDIEINTAEGGNGDEGGDGNERGDRTGDGDGDGGAMATPETLTGEAAAAELADLGPTTIIDQVKSTEIGDGHRRYTLVNGDGEELPLSDDDLMRESSAAAPYYGDRSEPYNDPGDLDGTESNPDVDVAGGGSGARLGATRVLADLTSSTPAAVSLLGWQTPLKFQGYRDTCVDFCTLAAMEARIRRQTHEVLDLSEQYANHVERMIKMDESPRSDEFIENRLGALGGGGTGWSLGVYSQYGVPERSDDETPRYISAEDFGKLNQDRDDPRYDWRDSTSLTQRAADDFNLANEEISIQIPRTKTLTPFPQTALDEAVYYVGNYRTTSNDSDLSNPSFFESILADEMEVMIELNLSCIQNDDAEVWQPTEDTDHCDGGHCVLLVGYDRTGDDEFFVAKNSHESWDKIDYDVIREGVLYRASWIQDVHVHEGSYVRNDLFLGRWNLTLDGTEAILDVNRLPNFLDADDIDSTDDHRVGALFDKDGNMYRVNGQLFGFRHIRGDYEWNSEWTSLLLSVDFENPHRDYAPLGATSGVLFMHPDDPTFTAGHFHPQDAPDDVYRGFYATKDGDVPTGYTRFSSFAPNALYGHWEVRSPVVEGSLLVSTLDGGDFEGEFADGDGNTEAVTGTVDGQRVRFTLPSAVGGGRFDGYVHSADPSKCSGHLTQDGTRTGMLFVRQAANTVEIVSPDDGADVGTTVTLEAEVPGGTGTEEIIWTTRAPVDTDSLDHDIVGRGTSTQVKLPRGEHTVYANYGPPEHDGFVVDSITITVS